MARKQMPEQKCKCVAEHNKNIYDDANGVCIKFIDTLLRIVIAVRKMGEVFGGCRCGEGAASGCQRFVLRLTLLRPSSRPRL